MTIGQTTTMQMNMPMLECKQEEVEFATVKGESRQMSGGKIGYHFGLQQTKPTRLFLTFSMQQSEDLKHHVFVK